MRRIAFLIAAVLSLTAGAACSDGSNEVPESPAPTAEADGRLVIYSGRNENLVRPLIERFEQSSGLEVEVRYADTTELTATLLEEGDASPADVFFAQDAGALAALAAEGRLAVLPEKAVGAVDERFRDPQDRFVGVTGRARTIAFNPTETNKSEVPSSIFEVADPKWKGRIGLAPSNASFVSHVSALRAEFGEEKVKKFLADLAATEPKIFDSNSLVIQAIAAGEVDLGLVNHYYALNEKKERPDSQVENAFLTEGAFVNMAGVAVLEGAENADAAQQFVEFLLSEEGQTYFREETNEYPLVDGQEGPASLPALAELKTVKVPLAKLGEDLRRSTELIQEAGLT